MKMNKKGFTLIELLVVVLIIGILAAIALPQYFKAVERSRSAEALSILTALGGAQQRYMLANPESNYAENFGDLDIDFVNGQHETVGPTASYQTDSFTITIDGGEGTATRRAGRYTGYIITKDFETGRVTCDDSAVEDSICTSIGLQVS